MRRAIAACLALLLQACGEGPPSAGALHYAIGGTPASLDPARADDSYSKSLALLIHDTPLRYKLLARPYELTPQLAVALPQASADGLRWRVTLREGRTFADSPLFADGKGREILASDLAWSLARHADPRVRSKAGTLWNQRVRGLAAWAQAGADPAVAVEGLQVLDRHSLEITLLEPFPDLPHLLAQPFAAVLPIELAAAGDAGFALPLGGSGPYVLSELDDAHALLLPRIDYRAAMIDLDDEEYSAAQHSRLGLDHLTGRAPPMSGPLRIDFLGDDTVRWRSFLRDDGNAFIEVPPARLPEVLHSWDPLRLADGIADRYHAHAGLESASLYFGFNLADESFGRSADPERDARNHRLRCAVLDALDPGARNRQFHGGAAVIGAGVIPPVVWTSELTLDPQDLRAARARAALTALAAEPQGLPELAISMVSGTDARQLFEAVRGWLVDAGYPAERVRLDAHAGFAAFNQAVDAGRVQLMDLGWGLDYPDPLAALQPFHGTELAPGPNVTRFADAQWDADFARASSLPAGAERRALIARMERRIQQACVVSPALSRRRLYLWHADVAAFPDREVLGSRFLAFARRR